MVAESAPPIRSLSGSPAFFGKRVLRFDFTNRPEFVSRSWTRSVANHGPRSTVIRRRAPSRSVLSDCIANSAALGLRHAVCMCRRLFGWAGGHLTIGTRNSRESFLLAPEFAMRPRQVLLVMERPSIPWGCNQERFCAAIWFMTSSAARARRARPTTASTSTKAARATTSRGISCTTSRARRCFSIKAN